MPKNPDELGSLWMKESAKGSYMTGEIAGQRVVCFQNKSDNPKAPQWRVLKAKPKGEAAPVTTGDTADEIPW